MVLETKADSEYDPILVNNPVVAMYEHRVINKGVNSDLLRKRFHEVKVEFTRRNSPLDYPITLSYLLEKLDLMERQGVSPSSISSEDLDSMLKQIEKERAESIGYLCERELFGI